MHAGMHLRMHVRMILHVCIFLRFNNFNVAPKTHSHISISRHPRGKNFVVKEDDGLVLPQLEQKARVCIKTNQVDPMGGPVGPHASTHVSQTRPLVKCMFKI